MFLNKSKLFLVLLFMTGSAFSDQGNCHGKVVNPIADVNWNLVFPIRIAGVKFNPGQGGVDSMKTSTSAMCLCPSHASGVPVPGILVSFHEPLYLEEIVSKPGCLSTLGGIKTLNGFDRLATELKEDENSISRWQIHWYQYPIFSVLDLFKDFVCTNHSGFALAYMTELDPTWQDDAWGAIFSPETVLFSGKLAQSACAVDALASTTSHPLDAMFWCAGSWGPVYPLTGNSNAAVGRIQSANLEGAKMIARLARMGLLMRTVGEDAVCHSMPMPVWLKSEFTLDPIYPTISHGNGLPIGAATSVWEYTPPQSFPGYENINQVVFQQEQCCIRP